MITITLTMLIMMKMMTLVICHHNDEDFACSCGEAFYFKPIHLKQSKIEVKIRVVLIYSSLPQVITKKYKYSFSKTNLASSKHTACVISCGPHLDQHRSWQPCHQHRHYHHHQQHLSSLHSLIRKSTTCFWESGQYSRLTYIQT